MNQIQQALTWVQNAKDGASQEKFIDDFEPIGDWLLADLKRLKYISVTPQYILTLTSEGKTALEVL